MFKFTCREQFHVSDAFVQAEHLPNFKLLATCDVAKPKILGIGQIFLILSKQ